MDDVGFTGKTFLKFRDFLLRSYLNPQKSKSSFGRTFYNFYSSDDLDKHFPGEKILSCFSDDEVNKILSFARNPNPLRSLIFKWENLRDNPFHTFWKLHPMTNFRHDIIESELDLVNERIFFTKKELLEDYEKSAPDDVPDLSSFGKEIQYLAKKGIVRTFSKENGFTDFHSFNTFPSDLNFQTCFLFRLLVMFSRIGPCSVLASFILDKFFDNPEFEFPIIFRGDKKFLISSLHSQTMYNIFDSISKQCSLHIEYIKNKENLRLDVTALSIVCNSYTGRFYLLYMLKNKSKLYSCPINNIYEAKVGELLEKPPYIDQILSQKFENIWDLEDENFYDNYQFFSFSLYGNEDFDDLKKNLSPLKVTSQNGSIFVEGGLCNAKRFLTTISRFIGRILDFNFGDSYSNTMLSPNTFFDSIKAIYDNYGIELNKYDIIPLSAAEPSREYIGPFDEFPVLREADYRQYIPDKYSEKTYDEDPELFSYIYSKEFVQILKNSEEAVPVSTAELRYLYSIIDYENFNNDSLSELRKFLESRSIKKLFTPSIFRHIRKNSFHSYENPAGNSICVLEIKDETSLFFDIMPETRENLILEENGIIKTYFHYDEREEDKIIPILFEFGTTTKVLEPSPLVSKIKYYLDRQKFLFSERHNKINHFNSNISR